MRRSVMTASVLAIAFAVPAFAQQTNAVDQQTREKVETVVANYVSAVNKGDWQALTGLYAQNFISIGPSGKRTTAAQVQEESERVHKRGLTLSAKVDDVAALFGGQGAAATAPYTGTFANDPGSPHVQGNFLFVLEHAGDGWKISIFTASRLVPPPPK